MNGSTPHADGNAPLCGLYPGLYPVTPDNLPIRECLRQVGELLKGGVKLLQYRDKAAGPAARAEAVRALLQACRFHGARLIINDDLELALAVAADGVHLGRDDGDPGDARRRLGPGRLLGVSCYAEWERAEAAVAAGADYIAFGALFESPTKPAAAHAPLELLGRAKAAWPGVAVCGIGGITLDNAPQAVAAGADLLAVISDVFACTDPRARALAYGALFAGAGTMRPGNRNAEAVMTGTNEQLFARAQQSIPGGVNSPVRAFRSVGGCPRFFARGEGSRLWDVEGREYIDYVGSWGPAILGHAHPEVVHAVQEAAARGLSFGAPTEAEVVMAETLCRLVPSMERVRLVSSGTEATMSAIRLARGYTGRDAIVKFEGCYHGHADSLLVKAGSGALTFGNPSSGGVPADFVAHTLVLDYNDVQQLYDTFAAHGGRIAAIIVEPVVGNMNLIRPSEAFLQAMRELCTRHGAVLIFDEVMTGFRVGPACAQGLFGITPDLTTLGKVIGGGMPVGAFGGRRDIMERIAPLGPVYQAGTLSGNPVAVAAGLKTLELIQAPGFFDTLAARTRALCDGLAAEAAAAGVAFAAQSVGGMFGLYFCNGVPAGYADVMQCDQARFNRFFHAMLERGVYLAPSAFEAGFVSAAHSDADLAETRAAAREAFARPD